MIFENESGITKICLSRGDLKGQISNLKNDDDFKVAALAHLLKLWNNSGS